MRLRRGRDGGTKVAAYLRGKGEGPGLKPVGFGAGFRGLKAPAPSRAERCSAERQMPEGRILLCLGSETWGTRVLGGGPEGTSTPGVVHPMSQRRDMGHPGVGGWTEGTSTPGVVHPMSQKRDMGHPAL